MMAEGLDRSDPSCWVYRPSSHKTAYHNKGRAILIGPRAQELILPRLIKAAKIGRIFPVNRTSLWRLVQRSCKLAFPHPTLSAVPDMELISVVGAVAVGKLYRAASSYCKIEDRKRADAETCELSL
jgi:hypothetical protein